MESDSDSVRCPNCNRRDIHKSNAKNIAEAMTLMLCSRKSVRCYDCYERFTVWSSVYVKPGATAVYGRKGKSVAA